mmetsp:Transcript_7480/g.16478  ORF Transcript_7480/g.16478 Transcript_7480/m.16478 type:complete len:395 (-) Transcript_7480:930-2114(-)
MASAAEPPVDILQECFEGDMSILSSPPLCPSGDKNSSEDSWSHSSERLSEGSERSLASCSPTTTSSSMFSSCTGAESRLDGERSSSRCAASISEEGTERSRWCALELRSRQSPAWRARSPEKNSDPIRSWPKEPRWSPSCSSEFSSSSSSNRTLAPSSCSSSFTSISWPAFFFADLHPFGVAASARGEEREARADAIFRSASETEALDWGSGGGALVGGAGMMMVILTVPFLPFSTMDVSVAPLSSTSAVDWRWAAPSQPGVRLSPLSSIEELAMTSATASAKMSLSCPTAHTMGSSGGVGIPDLEPFANGHAPPPALALPADVGVEPAPFAAAPAFAAASTARCASTDSLALTGVFLALPPLASWPSTPEMPGSELVTDSASPSSRLLGSFWP